METMIFRRYRLIPHQLISYGFMEHAGVYEYQTSFLQDAFQAVIIIHNGNVTGKVMDRQTNEEYVNLRISSQTGAFVKKVRHAYVEVLIDIRDHCFQECLYISDQAMRIHERMVKRYHDDAEHPWDKDPYSAVYRNKQSRKWYALIMRLPAKTLHHKQAEDILNIKLDPNEIQMLLQKDGFQSAYHMNKQHWITIVLDDTITDETIMDLVEKSHAFTESSSNTTLSKK